MIGNGSFRDEMIYIYILNFLAQTLAFNEAERWRISKNSPLITTNASRRASIEVTEADNRLPKPFVGTNSANLNSNTQRYAICVFTTIAKNSSDCERVLKPSGPSPPIYHTEAARTLLSPRRVTADKYNIDIWLPQSRTNESHLPGKQTCQAPYQATD